MVRVVEGAVVSREREVPRVKLVYVVSGAFDGGVVQQFEIHERDLGEGRSRTYTYEVFVPHSHELRSTLRMLVAAREYSDWHLVSVSPTIGGIPVEMDEETEAILLGNTWVIKK